MVTLFMIVTCDGWYEVQEVLDQQFSSNPTMMYVSRIVIIFIIIIGHFIMFNIFVGKTTVKILPFSTYYRRPTVDWNWFKPSTSCKWAKPIRNTTKKSLQKEKLFFSVKKTKFFNGSFLLHFFALNFLIHLQTIWWREEIERRTGSARMFILPNDW